MWKITTIDIPEAKLMERINKLSKKDKLEIGILVILRKRQPFKRIDSWSYIGRHVLITKMIFNLNQNTMKILKSITLITMLFIAFGTFAQNDKDQKIMKDAEKAKLKMIKKDAGLEKLFSTASGYAIFPNVGEGAFIIGGASGNGVVYENGKAIGMASLKKLDIGAQIGGQSMTEVIFFETGDALNAFKTEEYTFSAEASAVALESGVSQNANYDDGVLVIAMPKKGLMADASVGGQQFKFTPFKQ